MQYQKLPIKFSILSGNSFLGKDLTRKEGDIGSIFDCGHVTRIALQKPELKLYWFSRSVRQG